MTSDAKWGRVLITGGLGFIGSTLAMRLACEGADVTLVDSLAITRPTALGFLVRQVRGWCGLDVEVHCHNDFGLATA